MISGCPKYCAINTPWHCPPAHVPPRQSCPHVPQFLPSDVRSTQAFDAAQSVGKAALHEVTHWPFTHATEPVADPEVGAGQVAEHPVTGPSVAASPGSAAVPADPVVAL